MSTDPHSHIAAHILSSKSLAVSPTWLSEFLSTQRLTSTPLPALTQTALFRLLSSNITTSLANTPASSLPVDISDPAIKERRINGPVPVQVLDIQDIGASVWSQVEAIERVERGEETRGREIIRTVNRDETGEVAGNDQQQQPRSHPAARNGANAATGASTGGGNASEGTAGPHRLVLQDAKGAQIVAIELKPLPGVVAGKMPIGTKMVLKNATVSRGMVMLEPGTVMVLGGKIEAYDKAWKANRKARLLAQLQDQAPESGR